MSKMFQLSPLEEIVALHTEKVITNKDPQLPYIGLENIAQGFPKFVGITESMSSISTNSVFAKDDILFGKLRPNLRKSIKAPFKGYCSTDILVLRCFDGIDPGFVGHLFQWEQVFAAAAATAAGTKMPRTSWNEIKRFKIFKPPTFAEQSRIAAVLDTVDAAITRTEAIIAKLKQVRAGLLHDLLTRGLDENGQIRDPIAHPEQFKDSTLGRIPREWEAGCLGRAVTLQRGLDLPLQERHGGTIPIYGSNGIDGWHNQAGVKGPGVITGRSGTIGFVYYCEEDFWPLNTTLYVKNFHRNEPRFIRLFLEFMRLDKFSAATGVPSLNRNFVHPTFVAIPFPAEQLEVTIRIEDCEREIAVENNYLGKLTFLKSALMSDLLTGRVRVPEGVEVQL